MEKDQVTYKIQSAAIAQLITHLEACNEDFHPPLTGRINIEEYSRKISEKAITFEAWSADVLIGMVAVYFSDPPERYAYITNVSVLKEFTRLGVATQLLKQCLDYAAKRDITEIRLEVHQDNQAAIVLYRKFDFVPDAIMDSFVHMKLPVQGK